MKARWFLLWTIVAVAAYVLSSGPVIRLAYENRAASILVIYAPLGYCATYHTEGMNCPAVISEMISRYWNLFIDSEINPMYPSA
jgi:hypothetical protein